MQSAKSGTAMFFWTHHARPFFALSLGQSLDAPDRTFGWGSYQWVSMMSARNLVLTATSGQQRVPEVTEGGIGRSHVNTGRPVAKLHCHDVGCSAILCQFFWSAGLARIAPLHPPIWVKEPAMSIAVAPRP